MEKNHLLRRGSYRTADAISELVKGAKGKKELESSVKELYIFKSSSDRLIYLLSLGNISGQLIERY